MNQRTGHTSSASSYFSETQLESPRGQKNWKFGNLNKNVVEDVYEEESKKPKTTDEHALSEKALEAKGIKSYLRGLTEEQKRSRILYGFPEKQTEQKKIKYHQDRWCFMMSSRPLVNRSF